MKVGDLVEYMYANKRSKIRGVIISIGAEDNFRMHQVASHSLGERSVGTLD